MKTITLSNKSGSLTANIIPDYGGMMSELVYKPGEDSTEIPILYFDKSLIGVSNILAGGIPVLFPFLSWTEDDRYQVGGKEYTMPFHGLVKAAQFGVARQNEDSATLYIEPSEINIRENYPFDFRLELTYTLNDDGVDFNATVINRSNGDMPHYFGWHPWFTDSGRAGVSLKTMMKYYYEYTDNVVHEMPADPADLDLIKKTDYIIYDKFGNETIVESEADGYRVRMVTDDAFDVLLVNTAQEKAIIIEPWLAGPDSINTGKYVKYVPPGEQRSYFVTMHIEHIWRKEYGNG